VPRSLRLSRFMELRRLKMKTHLPARTVLTFDQQSKDSRVFIDGAKKGGDLAAGVLERKYSDCRRVAKVHSLQTQR